VFEGRGHHTRAEIAPDIGGEGGERSAVGRFDTDGEPGISTTEALDAIEASNRG
jgi:hypothetical protein